MATPHHAPGSLPGFAVALFDRELRCVLIGGPQLERAGMDPAAMVGAPAQRVMPRHFAVLEPALRAALAGSQTGVELHALALDDPILSVEVAPHRSADGAVAGVLCISRDVTAERRAQRAQREAEERFRTAFHRAPIGMAIVDAGGRFAAINDALAGLLGHSPQTLTRLAPWELVHPDDRAAAGAGIVPVLRGDRDASSAALRLLHADGYVVWVDVHVSLVRDGEGRPLQLIAQILDVTQRRVYEQRLRHMADHDPLTGLLNRRSFARVLDRHVAEIRRYGPTGALLVVDLDGFKHVNDTVGHAAGDELLVSCARALSGRLRDTDVLARLGGDEFAVLLPRADEADAEAVARDLVEVIRASGGTGRARVTTSVGVAAFDHDASGDAVLVRADRAMYAAKAAGRDRHAVHGMAEPTTA